MKFKNFLNEVLPCKEETKEKIFELIRTDGLIDLDESDICQFITDNFKNIRTPIIGDLSYIDRCWSEQGNKDVLFINYYVNCDDDLSDKTFK